MAEDVQQKLKGILKKHAKMNDDEVENFILTLMVIVVVNIIWSILQII